MKTLTLATVVMSVAVPAMAFDLSSPDIVPGGPIPEAFAFNSFGCTGRNLSPALAWADAPQGTESFAIMVHDPDAVTGGAGFWHWVVLDIPVSETELPQGSADGTTLPDGAREIATDFGAPGWGGPCPPEADGPHRYDVTIYALPVAALEIPAGVTASFAGFVVNQMALGSATFFATYDR